MEQEQRVELITFAEQQFAFLETEKGLTQFPIDSPFSQLLVYRNDTSEICLRMYTWTSPMEICIKKLGSDGKPVVEKHRRTVWLLESLLTRQFHIEDKRILALDEIRQDQWKRNRREHEIRFHGQEKSISALDKARQDQWEYEQVKRAISLYQALLQDHIDLLLQQPLEVLFPTATAYIPLRVRETEEWDDLLHDQFAFLREYGFRPDPVFACKGLLAQYIWPGADRAIQLILDLRDQYVDHCDIISLIDGKIPTTEKDLYQQPDAFTQGRGFTILLRDLPSVTEADVERIVNLYRTLNIRHSSDHDYTYFSAYAQAYAQLINRHIDALMAIPFEILFASKTINWGA